MALDFCGVKPFPYAKEDGAGRRTGKTSAVCEESDEERACALLEVSGGSGHPAFEWESLLWL